MVAKVANGLDLQGQRIQSVADPSSAQDAATKAYVDNVSAGLRWKQPVRVASTASVTVSNPGTAVFDGITLTNGQRILLKNQSTAAENGIYVFNGSSSALTRATDSDTAAELISATTFVGEGSTNADRAYTQTAEITTLGSDTVTWAQFGAGQTYTAGNGLTGSTTFSVLANGSSIDVSASGIKIADAAAGNGLASASGVLSVNTGSGLTTSADNVIVDSATVARRVAGSIGNGALTSITFTHNLGTADFSVSLYEISSGAVWIPDVTARSATDVTLAFAVAPTTNQFRVVVE